jgi:4-amino-4-deoxy-L-arabinose transferase-like glycosyltransferase
LNALPLAEISMNQIQTNQFTRADYSALAALSLLFALLLLASWQRWTQPLLDHGREMNLPARILAGEQLYTDVQFLYGPFAPYFNALLYRLFGVHLAVLHAAGVFCAVLILGMVYWLSRQLLAVWPAAVTTGLVLVVCALKSTANYVQPYAYAALYGLVFALVSLVGAVRFIQTRRLRQLGWIGLCIGLALLCKPELALPALAAAGAAWLLECLMQRRVAWRTGITLVLSIIVLPVGVYSLILARVPWRVLLEDNHVLFTNMPPQLVYFNRHISGLAQWPGSLWFSLAGLGVFAVWIGGSGLLGAFFSRRVAGWQLLAKRAGVLLVVGLLWREIALRFFRVPSDVTPFASAVFVLPILLIALATHLWQARAAMATEHGVLLLLSIFSFFAILRAFLNVTTTGPYTPFFLPVLLIVYLYVLLRGAPAWLTASPLLRQRVQQIATVLLTLLVVGMAVNSALRWRRLNTFVVSAPRGSFRTVPSIGQPLTEAICFVEQHSAPGETVLTLPIATTINFLTERPYPLREEIVHPGFLTGAKERDAIERIKARNVRLILLANLDTSEFRDRTFGLDYNQELWHWLEAHYQLAARFDSPESRGARLGDKPFFILAYEPRP